MQFWKLCLLASAVVNNTAETTSGAASTNYNNIIGIGGIIATIITAIISISVTWIIAKKTNKEMKLTYSIHTIPLFSKSVTSDGSIDLAKIKIEYEGKQLHNPNLLSIDIENVGNKAIENPPITIRVHEGIEIIPGYFEDTPLGYEKLWTITDIPDQPNKCGLSLALINPKQIVRARFFLDEAPQKGVSFECPMADLEIRDTSKSRTNSNQNAVKALHNRFQLDNIILCCIIAGLFVSINIWYRLLDSWLYETRLFYYISATHIILFVFGVLVITLLFNVFGLKHLDHFILRKEKTALITCSILVIFCIALTVCIVLNIISGFKLQIIIGIVVVIIFSIALHTIFLTRG